MSKEKPPIEERAMSQAAYERLARERTNQQPRPKPEPDETDKPQ